MAKKEEPCDFCGKKCKGIRGKNTHQALCKKNPNSKYYQAPEASITEPENPEIVQGIVPDTKSTHVLGPEPTPGETITKTIPNMVIDTAPQGPAPAPPAQETPAEDEPEIDFKKYIPWVLLIAGIIALLIAIFIMIKDKKEKDELAKKAQAVQNQNPAQLPGGGYSE